MSSNICPRCGKPIRLPQDEVTVVRQRAGRNKFEDRMVHKVCPTGQPVLSQVGGQEYCTNCGHAKSIHYPKCSYSKFERSFEKRRGDPDDSEGEMVRLKGSTCPNKCNGEWFAVALQAD